jgi:hypothetical protein
MEAHTFDRQELRSLSNVSATDAANSPSLQDDGHIVAPSSFLRMRILARSLCLRRAYPKEKGRFPQHTDRDDVGL